MALFTFHDPTVRNTSHDFLETGSLVRKFQFAIGMVGILQAAVRSTCCKKNKFLYLPDLGAESLPSCQVHILHAHIL